MPERPTNSATAAAAVATESCGWANLLGRPTVTTVMHDLSESHWREALLLSNTLRPYQEFEG